MPSGSGDSDVANWLAHLPASKPQIPESDFGGSSTHKGPTSQPGRRTQRPKLLSQDSSSLRLSHKLIETSPPSRRSSLDLRSMGRRVSFRLISAMPHRGEHRPTSIRQIIPNLLSDTASSIAEADTDGCQTPQDHPDAYDFIYDSFASGNRAPASEEAFVPMMSGALPAISSDSVEFVSSGAFVFSSPSLDQSGLNDSTLTLEQADSSYCFVPSDLGQSDLSLRPRATSNVTEITSSALGEGRPTSASPASEPNMIPSAENRNRSTDVLLSSFRGESMDCRAKERRCFSPTLPTEMLQAVYWLLGPLDFHAARHTCRTWLTASLEPSLLKAQSRRGGWTSYAEAQFNPLHPARSHVLSRYLVVECVLGGGWTVDPPLVRKEVVDLVGIRRSSDTDSERSSTAQARNIIFTASVCGKYALFARGAEIDVYALDGPAFVPIARLQCIKPVAVVAMHTTSEHLAVAALLDDRTGTTFNLEVFRRECHPAQDWEPAHELNNISTACASVTELGPGDAVRSRYWEFNDGLGDMRAGRPVRDSMMLRDGSEQHGHLRSQERPRAVMAMARDTQYFTPYSNPQVHKAFRLSEDVSPVQDNAAPKRCIYYNIGSPHDPPRSVAICPERRCTAFGCATGIELHWVDVVTGQPFNRFFPLAGSSDYLYFLPSRGGHKATKLRLISSAMHEEQRQAESRRGSSLSSFWGCPAFSGSHTPPITKADSRSTVPKHDIGHCHAVPLSDGYHIIFTDTATDLLCMGSDMPLGSPTRLNRRFVFEPPCWDQSEGANDRWGKVPIPSTYCSSTDLSYGVHIAACYGPHIVLYTVPLDSFMFSSAERASVENDSTLAGLKAEQSLRRLSSTAHVVSPDRAEPNAAADGAEADEQSINTEWMDWTAEPRYKLTEPGEGIWPMHIRGVYVGEVPDLVDLSVSKAPLRTITIWALSSAGMATAFQTDSGNRPFVVTHLKVGEHGDLTHMEGVDGGKRGRKLEKAS